MPSYRCYFLDGQDHIKAATDLEADTLAAAIDRALALLETHPEHYAVEIWQGARRLYSMISEQPRAPA